MKEDLYYLIRWYVILLKVIENSISENFRYEISLPEQKVQFLIQQLISKKKKLKEKRSSSETKTE